MASMPPIRAPWQPLSKPRAGSCPGVDPCSWTNWNGFWRPWSGPSRGGTGGWQGKADARLLVALRGLVLDRIPHDALAPEFRQGNTLGRHRRHWFRAKFGGNRFRLFFRADSRARVIVHAWVNDRDTLRKAGASSDPYAVFAAMLAAGNPPDDWPALLAVAQAPEAVQRFSAAGRGEGQP